jgi:hypothetical protein
MNVTYDFFKLANQFLNLIEKSILVYEVFFFFTSLQILLTKSACKIKLMKRWKLICNLAAAGKS